MSLLRRTLYFLLLFCATSLIVLTLASLTYESSLWYFKVLDFPRLLVLLALLICLTIFIFWAHQRKRSSWLLLAGLLSATAIQAYFLYPYTPLGAESVTTAVDSPAEDASFSIMVANVFMHNREAKEFLKIAKDKNPTFLLVMEVDEWWMEQLSELDKVYPYRMEQPNDNTYGMALYSKVPLAGGEVQYLNEEGVPSFRTKATLANGSAFQLFTIHPVPPKPSEYPDNIDEEEVALMKAGRQIADSGSLPTLMAGDLNDVGWSYNSRRFEKLSGLRDLRCGRGLFNTFDAKSLLLRWPLDYIYVSPEFKVLEVERLDDFGSDHFPYYARLVLETKN
ncbi:endonuclease/exonuclease/phosphatase family protein [Persicitalea jodogahamensis]|uniref:Endonuclease n=1 Tax=Persicitalea jodogahamensis TaxID=402147 RepID=A0A8J3D6Z6_9BACT|nr:endonuclease/exonuclease/phosphatase family protein [Persicitalea jodogahamensis]GHB60804.1 endonuclease [Persicitalea jodogahamensis]